LDKEANNSQVQNLHGKYASICGRYKWESSTHYPGRSLDILRVNQVLSSRGDETVLEKSAEVIVSEIIGRRTELKFREEQFYL